MNKPLPDAIELPTTRDNPFDPPEELLALGARPPLRPLRFPDGHVGWLVTGHAAARDVLADPRFTAGGPLRRSPIKRPVAEEQSAATLPGMFLMMDPPEHTRYRRMLTGQFTVRRMKQLEPRIQEFTDACLDEMSRSGPPVDLVRAFAQPIPSLVICELLGVPYADRARFQENANTMLSLEIDPEELARAQADITGYLHDLVRRKRADPGDDILSGLAEDGGFTDDELTGVAILLLIAGHETTTNMLALGTFALLRHPLQRDALVADPSLTGNAVEELLRYLSIVTSFVVRGALEEVEIEGHRIGAGESVVVSVPMVNRDPERFDAPNELNLHDSAQGHLAFGHGVHQCLGQQLARVEMRIGYRSLFDRFPELRLAVPPEEVPTRDDMLIYGVHSLPVIW